MRSSTYLAALATFISYSNVFAQSTVTDPTKRAELALSALQIWYNTKTGLWDTTGWWNSANTMTMVGNLAKYDSGNSQLVGLAKRIFANTITQAPAKNPSPGAEGKTQAQTINQQGNGTFTLFNRTTSGYTKMVVDNGTYLTIYPKDWGMTTEYMDVKDLPIMQKSQTNLQAAAADPDQWIDGFYDDDLWWALGWINAFDVTGNTQYLTLAEGIFKAVTKAWPTNCGGGIWWSKDKTYANAIANELFLSTAAHLANRASNKTYYVDWAKKEINWFLGSGMINAQGTINDGLTSNCKNNGFAVWSYNQGVILGGLVELNKAAPNATYLKVAGNIAKAAIKALADKNDVIHDGCEPNCGGDANQFKGIFMRNLQQLHAVAPDAAYVNTIQASANSIWTNDRDQGNRLSVDWAGPFAAPANASTHSSAMDALVAAITVK